MGQFLWYAQTVCLKRGSWSGSANVQETIFPRFSATLYNAYVCMEVFSCYVIQDIERAIGPNGIGVEKSGEEVSPSRTYITSKII